MPYERNWIILKLMKNKNQMIFCITKAEFCPGLVTANSFVGLKADVYKQILMRKPWSNTV